MPLEQLYAKSPMEEYAALPFGMQWGLGRQGYQDYRARQTTRDALVDKLNRQAVEEYNPTQIEQQNLANQQQKYMMPTYEAQGMEAQAKMNTPNYYGAKAASELAGFGSTTAESKVKQATAEGQLPRAKSIASSGAATQDIQSNLTRVATGLFQVSVDPTKLPDFLKTLNSADATQVQEIVKQHGPKKAAEIFMGGLQGIANLDPKHMQEMSKQELVGKQRMDELAATPRPQGSINNAELALMAAGGDAKKAMEMLNANGASGQAAVLQVAGALAADEGHPGKITKQNILDAQTQYISQGQKVVEKYFEKDPKTGMFREITKTDTTGPGAAQAAPADKGTIPRFTKENAQAGYNSLKSGQKFYGPDGVLREKP